MEKNKVSIIMPCYNSSAYIACAIESVLHQEYLFWELIIVDDCSTDDTAIIIAKYTNLDQRIISLRTEQPSGSPAEPRNIGISYATGRYIAFLDSDDIWNSQKLAQQIPHFKKENIVIVFSNYEKFSLKKTSIIKSHKIRKFTDLLKGNEIGCSTAIYDSAKIGKCYFSKVHHEDYVLWLSILRRGGVAFNVGTCLVKYRISTTSVSSNKFKVILWVWNIYYNIENLGIIRSIYYSIITLSKSFIKYIK